MKEYVRYLFMKTTGTIPLTQVEKRGGTRPIYHETDVILQGMYGLEESRWYERTCKARNEGRIRVEYVTKYSGRPWIRAYECDVDGKKVSNLGVI